MKLKKIFTLLFGLLLAAPAFSQNAYWVCFTDKSGCQFNPYTYFDAKAIERRLQQGVSLNDSSDFPLNTDYTRKVSTLSDEVIGESRWLNAMAVSANEDAIQHIAQLPFVKQIIPIQHEMYTAVYEAETDIEALKAFIDNQSSAKSGLHPQLLRMGGEHFLNAGIQGKGIRIAVLDAGFPLVDKHEAFRHLFENHRIVATYNFPKKQENVFGWNSHGTMTLSCIAGIASKKEPYSRLGLATEAEFLLARTEVDMEPKKEEVWWIMGVEWAEKHGANIVSSSLGYGDIHHEIADLNGQSPISRAANMAAAKGILICNSAGNEGQSKSWPRIILPADADSVLTVGGINPMTEKHQNFSSYGPTADGRLKPNVCAYASECRVAGPNNEHNYQWVAGTSFSCPLVAGFAACAWQSHPEYNAMQLKAEIEKSADLYPYYDYAMGYGVPQAGYFLGKTAAAAEKNIEVTREGNNLVIAPQDVKIDDKLYYHFRRADGRILSYKHVNFHFAFPRSFRIPVVDSADILCIHYKGHTETLKLNELKAMPHDTTDTTIDARANDILNKGRQYTYNESYSMGGSIDYPSRWGKEAKNHIGIFFGFGANLPTESLFPESSYELSAHTAFGLFYQRKVCKSYGWGISAELNSNNYQTQRKELDQKNEYIGLNNDALAMEFFQHFRLLPSENDGLALEVGVVGQWNFGNTWKSQIEKTENSHQPYLFGFENNRAHTEMLSQKFRYAQDFTLGARLRIIYQNIALFAQYDFSDICLKPTHLPENSMVDVQKVSQNLNAFHLKLGLQIRY